MSRSLPLMLCLGLSIGLGSSRSRAADPPPSAEQTAFFESKVRPLLVDQCQKCHGPDKQKGGLRLDSREAALTGGDLGAAVVPGNTAESLLVQAVRHADDVPAMPPSRQLDAQQVADLTRWVEMGAPWPAGHGAPRASAGPRKSAADITDHDRAHWSFQPVRRPVPPAVKDPAWVRNPIDAFILANLDAKGMRPNPPAAPHELVRRMTFDLSGLPPTPEEVEAFVIDYGRDPEGAVGRLADRLLASPRYGETWARHWLDLVRYAETNSYERDNPKPNAWRYRDYVIGALNADKPFDRFVKEQLAGDELPDGGNDGLVATGFFRLGIWDDEPTDREQARYDGLDDIVATTGQVFLGLTIDCARCHEHKIDPLPQADYYRLLAFFQNIEHFRNGGPTDEVELFADAQQKAARQEKLDEVARRRSAIQAEISSIENEFRYKYEPASGDVVRPRDLDELHYRFYRDTFDRLPDFASLKFEDEGELPRGLFDLAPRTRDDAFGFLFEGVLIVPRDGDYAFFLDSDDGSRLTVAGRVLIDHDGVHERGNEQTATMPLKAGRVPVRLEYFQKNAGLGLNVAWAGPDLERRDLAAKPGDRAALDVNRLLRTDGARVLGKAKFDHHRELRRQLETLRLEALPAETAMCVTERGTKCADTFVLQRGNPHVPGDRVEPGFPSVLGVPDPVLPTPAPGSKTCGRRTVLADWITSASNPLTSRVIVNRLWQHHFGRGIVRTPNDFGLQGDRPTHPELLDWLASALVAPGWHLQAIHRMIVTSNTYRMSSRDNPDARAKDPANDALWRFDMRRLRAEEVRDAILAVTGRLDFEMYGPSIYPEIPREVLAGQSVPGKGWLTSPPDKQDRRSIYVHVKRSLLLPILESFDVAETDRTTPVRFSTTQPTQALAMLNGAFLNRQAAALAERLRRDAGEDLAAQVRRGFVLVAGRPAADDEVRRAVALVSDLERRDGLDREAARRALCLVLLNLDEFLFLD